MNAPATLALLLLAMGAAAAVPAAPVVPRMLLLDGTLTSTEIVVVGERGTILRSTDLGQTWQNSVTAATATLTGVSFAPGTSDGWAVGHDALILATADGGRNWQQQWQGENLQDSFLDVLALDARHVIAIGAYGLVVTTADGGKTWQRRKIIEEDFHLNRISRGPDGTLYIAGEHGTLLRSSDQGANWEQIFSPYDGSFYGILPLEAHTLVAHGLRGRLYRSTDNGDNWTGIPNEQRVLIATALQLRDGAILFAGQSRAWFMSRDGGRSISPWGPPFVTAVAEVLELPDGSILALGEAGAVVLPKP